MIRLDNIFQEPLLEFGNAGSSPDIREGIMRYGPIDVGTAKAKTAIRLGFVGTPKTVHAFSEWLKQCSGGISTDDILNQYFNPGFPGLATDSGLHCSFLTDPSWVIEIPEGELKDLCGQKGAVVGLVDLFFGHIRSLFELSAAKPDVVLCLPPEDVRKRVKPNLGDEEGDIADPGENGEPDFHDYLKGLCLQTRSMFQLIWPRTYALSSKGVQDPATRAWNLFGALFYKAGGIPWKLQKPPGSLNTCYVGISFSRREEGGYMHSSLTQVFNDKGEGTILRGGIAHMSEEDHEVHLPKASAVKLLTDAINNYASANDKRLPDRVVIHKSSGFDKAELDGFNEAAESQKVRFRDYMALTRSQIRFFRYGSYPPLRGTHIIFDDENSLLYTRGSVPFYRKYPGPYVPRTLHIRYFQTDRSQTELAGEILALTKLNWNKTQFDSFFPITLAGSKQIGTIYKWCPNPPDEPISFAFFM
jgi:hypothetical protein